MGSFKPVTKERAKEIKKILDQSRATNKGVAFDKETGECLGTASLADLPDDRVGMVGKFDTHYRV